MATVLSRTLSASSNVRLGDARKTAKAETKDLEVGKAWIPFGDPTMKLR